MQFASPARAAEALSQLDGSIFQGRLLHLLPAARAPGAAAAPGTEVGDAAAAGSTYKAEKEAKLKARGLRNFANVAFVPIMVC